MFFSRDSVCPSVSGEKHLVANVDCGSHHVSNIILTHDGELGAGDVRSTDHPVVALVGRLALLDLQQVSVTTDADVILVAGVQFLGSLVPGQGDFWVVDLDLALEQRLFVGEHTLI